MKLSDALAKLLGVLVWPVLLAFVLIRFRPTLREFLLTLGELSFKGYGVEAIIKKNASTALVAASFARPGAATAPEVAAREAREATDVVAESVNSRIIRRASKAKVLWVDVTSAYPLRRSGNDRPHSLGPGPHAIRAEVPHEPRSGVGVQGAIAPALFYSN